MFNQVIELISIKYIQDDEGNMIIAKETLKKVYAKRKSISQSEFYKAGVTDLKPACVFVVRTAEYKGQDRLKFNNELYKIYRTFDTKNEMSELYCEVIED